MPSCKSNWLAPFQSRSSSSLAWTHREFLSSEFCCDPNRRPHLQEWKHELHGVHVGKYISQSETIWLNPFAVFWAATKRPRKVLDKHTELFSSHSRLNVYYGLRTFGVINTVSPDSSVRRDGTTLFLNPVACRSLSSSQIHWKITVKRCRGEKKHPRTFSYCMRGSLRFLVLCKIKVCPWSKGNELLRVFPRMPKKSFKQHIQYLIRRIESDPM